MKIALTGGIGSGKSHVCKCLAERGIAIYDCDKAAKRLMRTSETIRRELTELIGDDAYVDGGGRLNKAAVAAFLLRSADNNQRINAIVHPAVARDFACSGMQWMECAILFESGFDKLVDVKICVTAPERTRIERIMSRDGLTEDKAREWIARQLPQESVASMCDYVIVNDGEADIGGQIDRILNDINGHRKHCQMSGSNVAKMPHRHV